MNGRQVFGGFGGGHDLLRTRVQGKEMEKNNVNQKGGTKLGGRPEFGIKT